MEVVEEAVVVPGKILNHLPYVLNESINMLDNISLLNLSVP